MLVNVERYIVEKQKGKIIVCFKKKTQKKCLTSCTDKKRFLYNFLEVNFNN